MKEKLLRLRAVCCLALLFSCFAGNAQINYSEGFEGTTSAWTDDDFYAVDIYACNGTSIFVGESYSFFGFSIPAETQAPVGTSNGQVATLTYNYKLLDYYTEEELFNDPDWGVITVSYATSAAGPWTTIQTITPTNHTESASCAAKTATFTPPAGATVYLRFLAEANVDEEVDFYLLVDDITVTQAPSLACTGTPAASVTVSSSLALCNGSSPTLSLSTSYVDTGITYQWQSSADNITYANVATGGTAATYTATQTAATWYRAIVTCTASELSTTSTPVQVTNTGLACLCGVSYEYDVEPITLVNFAGINNTSSAVLNGSPAVEDFTGVTPAEVVQGQTYPVTLKGNTNGASFETFFTVFIDFNQDGDFTDAGEWFEIGSVTGSTGTDSQSATGDITIPADALTGLTYMRVFKLYNDFTSAPCGTDDEFGYGQVEDYLVNITAAPAVPELTYVNLQWPATLTIAAGETGTVYAQAYGEGITEAAGAGTGVTAWIGVNSTNTDPSTWATAAWVPATFNVQSGNNDEFMAAIGASLTPGTYYYASRFQLSGGDYLYGGYSVTGGGFWSAATNVSGVLTVNCNVDAPIFVGELAYCSGVTGADLPTEDGIVWYFGPTGDNAIPDDTLITTGTYFAAQTDGDCESATRTGVLINVTTVTADDPDDVEACDSYTLPALVSGNYFTEAGGTGTQFQAGDVVTVTMDIHVHAVSETNAACTDDNVFTVTIGSAGTLTADEEQSFNSPENDPATIEDIVITSQGNVTLTWYSDEDFTEVVQPGTALVDGATYYAVQSSGSCFVSVAVTVDVTILATKDFDSANFTYYPNPVSDVLTLNYSGNISAIEVYNLLGQSVMVKQGINANATELSLGGLSAGTYMVKVTIESGASKTIKVVKN